MPQLRFDRPGAGPPAYALAGVETVIGRDPSCDLVLDAPSVSRRHAALTREGDAANPRWVLRDLGSRNRTVLNGAPLAAPAALREGDAVDICGVGLRFHAGDGPPTGPSRPSPVSGGVSGGDPAETPDTDAGPDGRGYPFRPDVDGPGVGGPTAPGTGGTETQSILATLGGGGRGTDMFRLEVNPAVKLGAVLSVTRALAGSESLDRVLERTLEDLFRCFPQADRGFVLLSEEPGTPPAVRAARARGGTPGDGDVRISRTVVRRVMQTGEAVLSADVGGDSRFDASESIADLQLRSVMCVPLHGRGDAAFGVLQVDTADAGRQFSEDDLDLLLAVAAPVGLAAQNARLTADAAARREAERDLELAARIQQGFLPQRPPATAGYEFASYYDSAQSVGGDYFDYVPLPDGRVAVALGDVAGKGVPAALLMARMSASARSHLLAAAGRRSPDLLPHALAELNRELTAGPMGHRFITCVMLLLDPSRGVLHAVNAGHMAPLVRRADGRVEEMDVADAGMPLGIDGDQTFENVTRPLAAGECAVVFTDGITEAVREGADAGAETGGGLAARAQNLYGKARLSAAVAAAAGPVGGVVEAVKADVARWTGCGPQTDDICLVAVRRLP